MELRSASIWQPHAGQLEFLANDARFRVLACGRRWGKTDACAVQVLESLFKENATRHVILAPTQDQANLLFERVVEMLDAVLEEENRTNRTDRTYRTGDRKRRTTNDGTTGKAPKVTVRRSPYPTLWFGRHRVMARSGHLGRSLRGNEATDLIIDEAAFVPESLITEVAMPMLATTNGTLTLISTPRGMNHFWRFFQMGQVAAEEGDSNTENTGDTEPHGDGDGANRTNLTHRTYLTKGVSIWSRRAPSEESPYVSRDFLAVQRELISDRAYRVEYEAEFLDSAGRMFRTEAIDACLVPEFEEEVRGPFYVGVDWARCTDFTAVAVLAGTKEAAKLVHLERFQEPAWTLIVDLVGSVVDEFPKAVVNVDATGLGDPLEQMLRARLPKNVIRRTVFTNQTKAGLADRLAWMIETASLKMRPHPELIREMQHFEAVETPTGLRRIGAAGDYHDDLVIALGLACSELPEGYQLGIRKGAERQFSTGTGGESGVVWM